MLELTSPKLDRRVMTTAQQRDLLVAYIVHRGGRADTREIAHHFGERHTRIATLLKGANNVRRAEPGGAVNGQNGRAAVWEVIHGA